MLYDTGKIRGKEIRRSALSTRHLALSYPPHPNLLPHGGEGTLLRREPCAVSRFSRLTLHALRSAAFALFLFQMVAYAEEDMLVEKNLFSPERKKWLMEDPKEQKPEAEKVKKEITDISLFGTVIAGNERYAVLRTKQKGKKPTEVKTPYTVGDYINGFLIKQIEPKRVVLRDPAEDKEYQIFINDESKDRTVEKTEIKVADSTASDNTTAPTRRKGRTLPPPKQVENVDQLKARLQRSIDILKTNKSDLVRKQAERDLQQLEQMGIGMSDQDLQDLARMKQELEKLK